MARPRKDQLGPCATARIKDAFWELLEENDLKRITVNMLTQKAGCNRGTFYYHYDSLDELIYSVIEEELLDRNGLPRALFGLLNNDQDALSKATLLQRTHRFGLMMQRAGQESVSTKVKTVVVNMWETVLCNEDERLTLEARAIIEFNVSGMIGLIDYLSGESQLEDAALRKEVVHAISDSARFFTARICTAQSISPTELENRIKLFNRC